MNEREKAFMKAWLDLHRRIKILDTDRWYIYFAEKKLLPIVNMSDYFHGYTEEALRHVVLLLTLYLEDCVACGGNWRQFTRWHYRSYGRYLPFYDFFPEVNDYYMDDVSRADIAVLLWAIKTPADDFKEMHDPFDEHLLQLASTLYLRMKRVFEEAPVVVITADDWFMDSTLMEKERTAMPVLPPDASLPADVEHFLRASKGHPLQFFATYDTLKRFFVQALYWSNRADSLLPELKEYDNFVLYANPKGLLIAPGVAPYFADRRNPLYNARLAEKEAYQLFCQKGYCPFDLLKYAMENNLLPDARFPIEKGKELLHENWDFLARWFLQEYYEGD